MSLKIAQAAKDFEADTCEGRMPRAAGRSPLQYARGYRPTEMRGIAMRPAVSPRD